MKILLLGEYSGVFSELRKGFISVGHEVFMISNGDGYKKYDSDLHVDFSKKYHSFIYRVIEFILFRLGLDGIFRLISKRKLLRQYLSGYDKVLLVNPIVESNIGSFANFMILRYVFKNNKDVYLGVLGDDFYVSKYYCKHRLHNGFYNPTLKDYIRPSWQFKYRFCLGYKFVNDYVVKHVRLIIPCLPAYGESYSWSSKLGEFIPFPISQTRIGHPFRIKDNDPIVIFHGWQKGKECRKGNDIIDRVVRKIVEYYGDNRVKYLVVSNVPYSEYIQMFDSCHIFIDQLYAQDKGYNGLLGMAAGKVVLSGFKKESLIRYTGYDGLEIGISASADEDYLFKQLCDLIENPIRMENISNNAIDFVRRHHLTNIITNQYINIFNE